MFELKLSDEDRMLREQVKKFCENEVKPLVQALDREEILPYDLMRKYMKNFNPLAEVTDVEEAGRIIEDRRKGSNIGQALAGIELCKTSPSLALAMGASVGLAGGTIMNVGNRQQQERYGLPILRGEKIGAFAITEPSGGSDIAAMKSTALQDGDYYIINGSKTFITNGPYADITVYYAKTDPKAPGHRGMSTFLIEKGTPGFTQGKPFEKMGMRGSPTGELFCEDVRVHKSMLLGTRDKAFYELLETFAEERAGATVMDIAIIERVLEESIKYAKQRVAWGQSIAFYQAIQWKLVDMFIALMNCYAQMFLMAELREQGRELTQVAAASKAYAGKAATNACLDAIDIFGGYGYMEEYPLSMFMRDAKLIEIGGGTTEMQRIMAANMILRHDPPLLCPFDFPEDSFKKAREERARKRKEEQERQAKEDQREAAS